MYHDVIKKRHAEKAAEAGMMGSATTLGMIFEEGKIVDQDLDKAEEWYKKAGISK